MQRSKGEGKTNKLRVIWEGFLEKAAFEQALLGGQVFYKQAWERDGVENIDISDISEQQLEWRYGIGRRQNMFRGWWVIYCDWGLRAWHEPVVDSLEQQAKELRFKLSGQGDPWKPIGMVSFVLWNMTVRASARMEWSGADRKQAQWGRHPSASGPCGPTLRRGSSEPTVLQENCSFSPSFLQMSYSSHRTQITYTPSRSFYCLPLGDLLCEPPQYPVLGFLGDTKYS